MILSKADFAQLVQNAPLVSIDFIVERGGKYIFGKRSNHPAKGFFFVPGGRIHKDQTIEDAFKSLTKREMGIQCEFQDASFLGVFQHRYDENFLGEKITTHYVVLAYLIRVAADAHIDLSDQHTETLWLSQDDIHSQTQVHEYSRAYFPAYHCILSNSELRDQHASLLKQFDSYNTIIWAFPVAYLGGIAFSVEKLDNRPGIALAVGLIATSLLYTFRRHIEHQKTVIESLRCVESVLRLKFGSQFVPQFIRRKPRATEVVFIALVVATALVGCCIFFKQEALSVCPALFIFAVLVALMVLFKDEEQ